MPLQWSNTSTVGERQGLKVLTYGGSGAGKTTLIATAPRPVVASAEAGLLSLQRCNIPYAEIRTLVDLWEFYRWAAGSAEARNNFSTLCLDSLSEIGEKVLAGSKAVVKDPRQAYGELQTQMETLVKAFRDLPGWNVYFSAKEEVVRNAAGQWIFQPSMPGQKVGPSLPYLFDEVFYLGVAKTPEGVRYRYLMTETDGQYVAKDRSGSLDVIERPDLTFVFNKMLGVQR